jgi:hypothetical protein
MEINCAHKHTHHLITHFSHHIKYEHTIFIININIKPLIIMLINIAKDIILFIRINMFREQILVN